MFFLHPTGGKISPDFLILQAGYLEDELPLDVSGDRITILSLLAALLDHCALLHDVARLLHDVATLLFVNGLVGLVGLVDGPNFKAMQFGHLGPGVPRCPDPERGQKRSPWL